MKSTSESSELPNGSNYMTFPEDMNQSPGNQDKHTSVKTDTSYLLDIRLLWQKVCISRFRRQVHRNVLEAGARIRSADEYNYYLCGSDSEECCTGWVYAIKDSFCLCSCLPNIDDII